MLQLVRFDDCIHVFDNEKRCFVKTTARRVSIALGVACDDNKERTRKIMLRDVKWQKCAGCHLGKRRDHSSLEHRHWIASPY